MAVSQPSLHKAVMDLRLTSPEQLSRMEGPAQTGVHSLGARQQVGPTSWGARKELGSSWARPWPALRPQLV